MPSVPHTAPVCMHVRLCAWLSVHVRQPELTQEQAHAWERVNGATSAALPFLFTLQAQPVKSRSYPLRP